MGEIVSTMMREASISFPMLGDFSIDPPSYFTVFGKNIYFYGVIIALGVILASLYCVKHINRYGLTEDDFYGLLIWVIPVSVISSRLYFVLFYDLQYYLAHPKEILAVWNGGLAIYGGIIGGVITGIVYCRIKKIRFFAAADLFSFGLLIGQAVGRWGNFMNREAFGGVTDIFCRMGLTMPGAETVYVHPTFLYESLWNFIGLILIALWAKKGKRKYDGQVFLLYTFWYGLGRSWIEGLRTDSLYIGATNIRVSQLLAAAAAVVSLVILIINSRKSHDPARLFVNEKLAESQQEETENG